MIETDLVTKLKTLTAYVYAMQAPDEFELPLIVYTAVNTVPIRDFSSFVSSAIVTFEIDIYHLDYIAGKALMRQARDLIMGWSAVNPVMQDARDDIDKTMATPIYRCSFNIHLFDRGS